jgi:hypothetical protein
MPELKNCPFCGEMPEIKYYNILGKYEVQCVNRRCPTTSAGFHEEEAVTYWNTRPIESAIQQRIDELEKQNRWILVSERLPKRYNDVLVIFSDLDMDVTWLGRDGEGWHGEHKSDNRKVTHWRYLPSAPKEEE